jgi:hypothetical protein
MLWPNLIKTQKDRLSKLSSKSVEKVLGKRKSDMSLKSANKIEGGETK